MSSQCSFGELCEGVPFKLLTLAASFPREEKKMRLSPIKTSNKASKRFRGERTPMGWGKSPTCKTTDLSLGAEKLGEKSEGGGSFRAGTQPWQGKRQNFRLGFGEGARGLSNNASARENAEKSSFFEEKKASFSERSICLLQIRIGLNRQQKRLRDSA